MKFLSPPAHGVFDFVLILLLALAPFTLDFTGPTAWTCYGLAVIYLLLVLGTDYPLGLVRLLSYRLHGGIELVSSIVLLISPYAFGFANSKPDARNFFMSVGAARLMLWWLTDWSGQVPSDMADNPHDNLAGNRDSV
jgi:hypothetical protein